MNIVLKSKRFNTQQQWVEVWDNIEKYVTRAEMESAEQAVLADMKEKLSAFKKPIYGYSAGKDSIVLAELCRKADVDVGVMSITGLEYPAFDRWARENKPSGVEIISTGQDLEWLGSHPSCFLRHRGVNSDMQTRLNRQIQHRFYDKVGADVILLGRRKADGNYGGRNRSNIYMDPSGRTKYNPIFYWPHELVLAYIIYNGLQVPPIYEWPDGYFHGTHPWFYREVMTTDEAAMEEIYQIDPLILAEAAEYVPVIADFLKTKR